MANILLVDDDDLLVNGQSDFLRRAGHTVSTAGNGNEADVYKRQEHHCTMTFQDELRALFQRHGIEDVYKRQAVRSRH